MAKKFSVGKKKKIKSRDSVTSDYTPKGLNFKKENITMSLVFLGWLILCTTAYITAVYFQFAQIQLIYSIAGSVLFLCYFFANGGVKRKDFSEMEKPPEMGYDEFHALKEKLKTRAHYTKYFFVAFAPFPLVVLTDYVIIVWGAKLAG